MAIIKQHLPNYVSIDPKEVEFETLEDLMNVGFIKQWTDKRWGNAFHRFSTSYDPWYAEHGYDNSVTLMAELDGGKIWYVIGYIYGLSPEEIGLPEWKMVREGE